MSTGAIVFYGENGRKLLQERASGGKTFAPILVEGTQRYNTKVAVLFVVSNKNYGFLSDNYSVNTSVMARSPQTPVEFDTVVKLRMFSTIKKRLNFG